MIDQDEQKFILGEDYFLQHYGKKGMKWGQRKAQRQQNRAMNRASSKKDWAKQRSDVEAARGRVASGQTQREFKAAKAQFKQDKLTMGSREARKILNEARNKKYAEINKSNEIKTKAGSVAVASLLIGIGALSVANAVARAR